MHILLPSGFRLRNRVSRMKALLIIISFTFIINCSFNTKDNTPTPQNQTIDYKALQYKLFIGQTKDSVKKIIHLSRDYNSMDRGIGNGDTGISCYMNVGEDLLSINKTDALPALFFNFYNNKLTDFTCSIIFARKSPENYGFTEFINAVEPLFEKLRIEENKTTLYKANYLNLGSKDYIERYKIDTTIMKPDMLFTYEKKVK